MAPLLLAFFVLQSVALVLSSCPVNETKITNIGFNSIVFSGSITGASVTLLRLSAFEPRVKPVPHQFHRNYSKTDLDGFQQMYRRLNGCSSQGTFLPLLGSQGYEDKKWYVACGWGGKDGEVCKKTCAVVRYCNCTCDRPGTELQIVQYDWTVHTTQPQKTMKFDLVVQTRPKPFSGQVDTDVVRGDEFLTSSSQWFAASSRGGGGSAASGLKKEGVYKAQSNITHYIGEFTTDFPQYPIDTDTVSATVEADLVFNEPKFVKHYIYVFTRYLNDGELREAGRVCRAILEEDARR